MYVKIDNLHLIDSVNFLSQVPLKGKQSRQRSKFMKLLIERQKEVDEQLQELLKEHCHLDAEGNPKKKNEDKEWDIIDLPAFVADKKELYDEEYIVEGANNDGMLKALKVILDNCEMQLSGFDAAAYDYLCDQFEKEE